MKVSVDISEVRAVTREAKRSLARNGDVMKRTLDRKAAEERRTHDYRNRTHRLENSTFALGPVKAGDLTVVEFGARMEYASFVNTRGLMRVDELAQDAERELDFYFDGEAERIGGM